MAINPINNGEALSSVRTKLNQAISGVNTLETDKVNKSGDTMTGALTLPANGLTIGTDQLVATGGNVGIGTSSPAGNLDIAVNGNRESGNIMLGGKAPNTPKWGAIVSSQFDSAGEPEGFTLITGTSTSSVNEVRIGGALNEQNAATEIKFLTANNTTTRTGTQRMNIDSSGRVTMPFQPHIVGTPGLGSPGASGVADRFAVRGAVGLSFGNSRITVPVAGTYLILFQTIATSGTGRIDTNVFINGSTVSSGLNDTNTTGFRMRTHTVAIFLQANDFIQFSNASWYVAGNTVDVWQTASVTLLG